jgi:hypothetical protein
MLGFAGNGGPSGAGMGSQCLLGSCADLDPQVFDPAQRYPVPVARFGSRLLPKRRGRDRSSACPR